MRLQVDQLTVMRRQTPAVDGLQLQIDGAELVALVGPNGAGKTTLMRTLSGLIAPHRGSITLLGTDITHLAPEERVKRGLVHVPEGRRLFGTLTVAENLELGCWCHGDRDLGRVLAWLPELAPLLEQPAGSLSTAEAQLCAVARALAANPAVLLIDEISLGLSPAAASRLFSLLPELVSTGMAVLFVEQDLGRALSVADRVYALDRGRVVASGPPGELLVHHAFRGFELGV